MKRFVFPLLAALVLPWTACAPLGAGVQSVPLVLDPDHPGPRRVGRLEFRGGLVLTDTDRRFGGLSALWVSPGGRRLVALTDRGAVVTADIRRTAEDDLAAVENLVIRPLPGADGKLLRGAWKDAEGMARLPDGRWFVGFERHHRIWVYGKGQRPDGRPEPLSPPAGLDLAPDNGGIEALAGLPDGRLLAIEEGQEEDGEGASLGIHRAWIGPPGAWTGFSYRAEPPYRPTDATLLPDGDLLVLERRASILGGFGARLVRVPAGALDPAALKEGAVVEGDEIARIEPPLAVDNMEGLAAVPSPRGGTDLYLVSDDNFWALQRTILLMFHLPADAS